jgi:hypothetical protein
VGVLKRRKLLTSLFAETAENGHSVPLSYV